jgi:hypothetical protein
LYYNELRQGSRDADSELFWNENNVGHLWSAHRVNPEDVEEIVFGIPGSRPSS